MANAEYKEFCVEFARVFQEDLAALLGVDLRVRGPEVGVLGWPEGAGAASEAGTEGHPLVSTACVAKDGSPCALHLAFPRQDAVTFAGLLMALEKGDIEERRKQALQDDTRDAIGEIVNTSSAILSRICEEMALPGLRGEPAQVTDSPSAEPEWLPAGRYRRARWTIGLTDYPDARVDLLVPEATLSEWFGEELPAATRSGAEPRAKAEAEAGDEADAGTTLVVIDGSEDDRIAIEALEDDLELPVWAIDPEQISVAGFEELSDAAAILVDWDLGAYSGLEMLQALRTHPTTARMRIALASANATRRRVMTALRHGADTFVMKPYDAAEIRARLGFATEAPDADAPPAPEPATRDEPSAAPEPEAPADA